MSERRKTFSIDIEGRRIVCYSNQPPQSKEFSRFQDLGFRFITILENHANYCFVDIPY